jgi:hypothetical protein
MATMLIALMLGVKMLKDFVTCNSMNFMSILMEIQVGLNPLALAHTHPLSHKQTHT